MRHGLVHVGAVIFRCYIYPFAKFKMILQKCSRVSSEERFVGSRCDCIFLKSIFRKYPPPEKRSETTRYSFQLIDYNEGPDLLTCVSTGRDKTRSEV